MATAEARIRRIERVLEIDNVPKAYSFSQVVEATRHYREGMTVDEAFEQVGSPEAPIRRGEKTVFELIGKIITKGAE